MKIFKYIPILMILGLAAVPLHSHAQKFKLKLAEESYNAFNFRKAAEIYEDIIEKNPDDASSTRRAGECRMRINDFDVAVQHYRTLDSLKESTPEDLLNYAYVLKVTQQYDAAVVVYEYYMANNEDEYLVGYTDVDWANRIVRDSSRFELTEMSINSPQSDFAPAFAEEGIVFSSARKQGKGKRNIYSWTDQSYLNLYEAKIDTDSTLMDPKVMKNKANSRFHEGTITYDLQQKIIYFTRNNYLKGKQDDDGGRLNLGIYYASYAEGKIKKLKPFPFNDPTYSVGHPVISPDGKAMYFVSDQPGGQGGTDIYVSYRNLDFWSEPENLGPKVNTPGNEMFPFIDEQGTFYFASDWHPGLGGLDLFYTELDEESVPVKNFGYPINSSYDDFGLITYPDGLRGYLSSNRPGGTGDDDIYAFKINPATMVQISGRLLDQATGNPIPNGTILLKDQFNQEVLEVVANTDAEGRYQFDVPFDETYTIMGVKNGYFQAEKKVNSSDKSGFLDRVDLELTAYDYAAEGRVLYSDTGLPAVGATVTLTTIEGEELQQMLAEDDGSYFFGLDPETQYMIEAIKAGYPPQSIEVDTRGKPATVIHSDLRLFKYEEGTVVRLDNIYYDYNKSEIRDDARRDLDRLVQIMNENPNMKIELSSHTDARGTDSYNLRLSDRRAKAAVNYLVSKGIDKKRMTAKGYGETKLLNDCGNDVECTEREHQLNRRTEFKILDI
ncbi:OmpA family protein [Sanyastnella coralliicola]|uniref:OmpA family protein n=1 Tax=Sanyastnella coralliicola TaxID=3069118 RepID=UPI0027B9F855|nr:OmpA family protein [Longitalea sp. SCSIO 12813]